MRTIIRRHKKCRKCKEFRNHWIYCEVCRKFICVNCAGNEYLCKDHYINAKDNMFIDEYFREKYEVPT